MKWSALTSLLSAALLSLVPVGSAHAAPAAAGKANRAGATGAVAAASGDATPESMGAQAFLEDILARRYSQELGTRVDRQAFSVGAQLTLKEMPPVKPAEAPKNPAEALDAIPPDLLLGTLDPEELLKKYGGPEATAQFKEFWAKYRIQGATISVGLKPEMSAESKAIVEKWLNERVKTEFKGVGKGAVFTIQGPAEKPAAPKTPLDLLNQFQSLAGQLALALAILLGILIWKLVGSKDAKRAADATVAAAQAASGASIAAGGGTSIGAGAGAGAAGEAAAGAEGAAAGDEGAGAGGAGTGIDLNKRGAAEAAAGLEVKQLSRKLLGLAPQLAQESERLFKSWCNAGDEGRLKLACYVEAVGAKLGRLPIPVDALEELAKTFAKMPDLKLSEKRDTLRKAYWDMVMALNLGPESLEQPFGYLGSVKQSMMSEILMDQNAKMKALVSLYMPNALRESYMRGLDLAAKRELLRAASEMSTMPAEEFTSVDRSIKARIAPTGNKNVVSLGSALPKLIGALSPLEEATLVSEMSGPALDVYRRSSPSLAFLGDWPDAPLGVLMSRLMPDELVALLRVRGDLKERCIGLAPPMTAEVAGDELSGPDNLKDDEKNRLLGEVLGRIRTMIEQKELNLETVFAAPASASGGGTSSGENGDGEITRAAA